MPKIMAKTSDLDLPVYRRLDLAQRGAIRYFLDACDPSPKLLYDRLNKDGKSPNGG